MVKIYADLVEAGIRTLEQVDASTVKVVPLSLKEEVRKELIVRGYFKSEQA